MAVLIVLSVVLASCKSPGSEVYREDVCGRTPQVRDAILENLSGVRCAQVTLKQLGTITELDLQSKKLTELKAEDFDGLTNLETLDLGDNDLVSLPPGVFDKTPNLETLNISENGLEFYSLPQEILAVCVGCS